MPKRKRQFTIREAIKRRRRRLGGGTAKRALTLAKQVKKMVNKTIERSTVDWDSVGNGVGTAGWTTNNLFAVTQGNTDGGNYPANARSGNAVTLMKEKFYFQLRGPGTTGVNESNNIIRIIIAESTEGNQQLQLSDILKYSNQTTHGHLVFTSPYQTKTDTNKRYKVHYDKVVKLNYYSSSFYRSLTPVIKHGKTGRVVNFNNNAPAPTDYNLTVWVISDSAAAQHPVLDFAYRGVFRDA
jgi:hypothetical protein